MSYLKEEDEGDKLEEEAQGLVHAVVVEVGVVHHRVGVHGGVGEHRAQRGIRHTFTAKQT